MPSTRLTTFLPACLSCCCCCSWNWGPQLKRCENLPNKKQLYATIARMLKQPAQKIAVGIKQVPGKLAYGIKAIAELDEDKSKLAGDVAKPKAA
jgi:large subunit ribosomal protein L10